MKNARGFFLACAPAMTPSPATMITTSSANGFLSLIGDLLFGHILADPTADPSAAPLFGQTAGGRVPMQHTIGRGAGKRRIGRHREERDAPFERDRTHVGAEALGCRRRQTGGGMLQ